LIIKLVKAALKPFLYRHFSWVSEAGQDLWVFGEVFNEKRNGYFLDVGAADGVGLSNTYLLERRYGWKGICIEANPDIFQQLRRNRRVVCVNACLDSTEDFVNFAKRPFLGGIVATDTLNKGSEGEVITLKTKTLNSVLDENNAPNEIDYLSIDVEGAEQRILGGFNFKRYRFNCITIENPNDLLRTLLEKNEYILIKEIRGMDCFYIHQNFLNQHLSNLRAFYNKKHISRCVYSR